MDHYLGCNLGHDRVLNDNRDQVLDFETNEQGSHFLYPVKFPDFSLASLSAIS